MLSSSAATERRDPLARWIASLLLVVAVVCLTAAWALHSREESRRDALRGDNPADQVLVPVAATVAPDAPSAPSVPDRSMVPDHLYVRAIGVDTRVVPAATRRTHDPFLNRTVDSFGVPDDMYSTTWWSSGPKPGSGQLAVILGHTQIGAYGVFNRLAALHPGDSVQVSGRAGLLRFTVTTVRTGISKTDPYALRTALERHPAGSALALITCSGTFDRDYDQSTENTVVFAKLA